MGLFGWFSKKSQKVSEFGESPRTFDEDCMVLENKTLRNVMAYLGEDNCISAEIVIDINLEYPELNTSYTPEELQEIREEIRSLPADVITRDYTAIVFEVAAPEEVNIKEINYWNSRSAYLVGNKVTMLCYDGYDPSDVCRRIQSVLKVRKKNIEKKIREVQNREHFGKNSYEGKLKDGLPPDGFGKAYYQGGSIYEGEFKNGKRHGQGKLKFGLVDLYEGEWVNDKRSGTGVWKKNGSIYYTGEWLNDERSGKGSGQLPYAYYEGEWKYDEPNGLGKMIDSDGRERFGFWENGSYKGYKEENIVKSKSPAKEEKPAAVTGPAAAAESAAKAPATDTEAIKLCIIGAKYTEKNTLASAITKVAYERIADNPPGLEPSAVADVDPSVFTRIRTRMSGSTNCDDQEWICFHTGGRAYQLACWPDDVQKRDIIAVEMANCDGAILMVDAMDGVQYRTEELARLAVKVAGIPIVAIMLDNCDIITDTEMLEIREFELREALEMFDCDSVPIFRISASQACKDPMSYDRNQLTSGDTLMTFFSYLDGFDFPAAKAAVNAGCDLSSMPGQERELFVSAYYVKFNAGGSEEPICDTIRGSFIVGTVGMSGYIMPEKTIVTYGDHFRARVSLDEGINARLGQKLGFIEDDQLVATAVITGLGDDSNTN